MESNQSVLIIISQIIQMFPPKPLIFRIGKVSQRQLPPILDFESIFPSMGKQKLQVLYVSWDGLPNLLNRTLSKEGINVLKMVCSKHHSWKKMFLPPHPFFFPFQTHTRNHLGLSMRAVVANGGKKETTQVVRCPNPPLVNMPALNTRRSFARFFRFC